VQRTGRAFFFFVARPVIQRTGDVTKHPKRRRKPPQRQRIFTLSAPPSLNDDQVLTFAEWCALNGISPRTGRRILDSPDGPPVVWLSPRRFGIRAAANRAWQQARETRRGA